VAHQFLNGFNFLNGASQNENLLGFLLKYARVSSFDKPLNGCKIWYLELNTAQIAYF